MAVGTIGSLKIEIGADIRGLEREIRKAERAMQTATSNLSDLSRKLSLAVSIPILGIGAGAVKAAGDLEALKLAMKATFEGAGRSAAEAAAEVENLRLSARAPGLDFEQAVKASVRLQAVGFSAEKARFVIEQLANTVSSTGGTAEDLGEVVNQFSQMIGKGKVFQDDLKIITGRMPVVARLMKDAFGTTTAEGLNQLGVSSKDFVDVITKKMEGLPRATGGISNAIVNAFNSIKQGAATLGESLNKTLDVTGRLDQFGAWLEGLATKFNSLSDTQQRFIIGVGVFAAALGPALKIGQAFSASVVYTRIVFLELQKALLLTQTGGVGGLIAKWKALDLAIKASYIGIAVSIVVALGTAIAVLSSNMDKATRTAASLAEVEKQAAAAAGEERAATSVLIDVLRDENASRVDKEGALKRLQEIAPKYFKDLTVEKASIEALNVAYSAYIDSILRAARAKSAQDKLIALDAKAQEIAAKKARLNASGTSSNAVTAGLGGTIVADISAKNAKDTFTKAILEEEAALNAEMEALKNVIRVNTDFTASTATASGATNANANAVNGLSGSLGIAAKKASALKEVMSDLAAERARQDLLGAKDVEEEANAIESALKKLLDAGFAPTSAAVQNLRSQLKGLFDGSKIENFAQLPLLPTPTSVTPEGDYTQKPKEVDVSGIEKYLSYSEQLGAVNTQLQEGIIGFGQAFDQVGTLVSEHGSLIEQVFMGVGTAISQAASSGADSFAELGNAAATAAAKIVRAYIQQGVAAAVAKALGGLPFPLNLAAGAASGGIAAALFTKAITAIGVPKFANGVKDFGGGLAMVGERGRELVTLPKGSQVHSAPQTAKMLGGMGGLSVTGELRAKGTDLVALVELTQEKNSRKR